MRTHEYVDSIQEPVNMPNMMSAHDVRSIADAAPVDERTVRRYLEGKPLRALSVVRIEKALVALGIADPDPARSVRRRA